MNEKKVLIITIVCLVLIVLSGGAAIYYFQFDLLPQRREELKRLEQQVREMEAKVAKIKGLKDQIIELTNLEKEKLKHIPNLDRSEYDVFAERLDQLRRKAGVFIPSARWITAARPTPAPNRPPRTQPTSMHRVQYDLAVEGSFYQLLRFVNLLEQERRFINIDNFSIVPGTAPSATARGPQALRRDMKIVIFSFTYKLPEPTEHVISAQAHQYGRTTEPPE